MTTKKKGILALLTGATACLCTGAVMQLAALAATPTFQLVGQLPTDLAKGDEFVIPKAKFGETDALHYLHCPDGTVYTSESVELLQHGKYTIQYTANIDGKSYIQEQSFSVANPLVYFKGDGDSSFAYGEDERTKREGINAYIAEGDEFVFNQVVDLNTTSIDNPAAKFTFIPTGKGMDVSTLNVRFTDVYDETNTVDIKMNLASIKDGYYWGTTNARAVNQQYKAIAEGLLRVNGYGQPFCAYGEDSAAGLNHNKPQSDIFARQYLAFWLDTTSNIVYMNYGDFTRPWHIPNIFVIDLDDASYQEVEWGGFTTGEVYVSITGSGYIAEKAGIQFLAAGGNDLTAKGVEDVQPEITVDMMGYTQQTLPTGTKGYSYPVFNAIA